MIMFPIFRFSKSHHIAALILKINFIANPDLHNGRSFIYLYFNYYLNLNIEEDTMSDDTKWMKADADCWVKMFEKK